MSGGGRARAAPPSGPAADARFKRRKRRARRGNSKFSRAMLARRATRAPYNDNRFLMEEHVPDAQDFLAAPRNRDSSFSVDSDAEDYFYPLPEDEEDFLTREFSSVYEDAQSERLMNMSKAELMREHLALQAKCEMLSRLRRDAAANEALAKLKEQEALVEELRLTNRNLLAQLEQARKLRSESSSRDSESDSSTTPDDAGGDSPEPGD